MLVAILIALGLLGLISIIVGNILRQEGRLTGPVLNIATGVALIGLAAFMAFVPFMQKDLNGDLARARQALANEQQTTKLLTNKLSEAKARHVAIAKASQEYLERQQVRYRALEDLVTKSDPIGPRIYAVEDDTTPATPQTVQEAHERLVKRIEKFNHSQIRTGSIAPPKRQLKVAEILRLKDKMAFGFETKDYKVEAYPDNELITGRKGRYYVVDMKDAQSGVRFSFEAGRYTLARSDRAFRQALGTFVRDIAKKLEGSVDYSLYVRGSADAAAYSGAHEQGFEYKYVDYMPSVGGGRYLKDVVKREIGRQVENKDLPFLRAEFLRNIVRDVYPLKPPLVLQGSVTNKVDNSDRNVELILFADW